MSIAEFQKLPGNKPKRHKPAGYVAEKKVMKACLEWCRVHGILAWRNNTGSYEAKDKYGNPRYIAYGEVGSGDILMCIPPHGRHGEIECKGTDGKLSESQIERKRKVEAAGGIYIEARSVDDLAPLLAAMN